MTPIYNDFPDYISENTINRLYDFNDFLLYFAVSAYVK